MKRTLATMTAAAALLAGVSIASAQTTVTGAATGAVAGGLIGGPVGAVIGGGIGATAGAAAEPRYYHERDFYGSYAYSPGFFYAQPFATGCGDPRHPHTCY